MWNLPRHVGVPLTRQRDGAVPEHAFPAPACFYSHIRSVTLGAGEAMS